MNNFKFYLNKIQSYFESQEINNIKDNINDLLIDITINDENKIQENLMNFFFNLENSFNEKNNKHLH